MNHTARLAEFVIHTREVPAPVMHGARDALIDTLGCGLAGTLEETSEIVTRYVRECGGAAQATVWGHGFAATAPDAAFANGVASHALDFDDVHRNVHGHPSTTLVPALLAVAEHLRTSGVEVLAAYAVGLEVAGKLGAAFGNGHYQRGWHATATTGVFASAAACARLMGLSVEQLRHALGLAASQAAGLLRNFGTMTKPFHAGHAARCGVVAANLAKHGFTADTSIFDGDRSFLTTYTDGDTQPLGELLDRLGQPWEVLTPGISYKRWPCCYCNHRSIGGLLAMITEHDLQPADIEAIEIGFPKGTATALISENPQTGLEGKFSIEYVAAATLLDRKITLETFTDVMVQRPAVRALMAKVKRLHVDDGNVYSGSSGYNDVKVRSARGEFTQRIEKSPGSAAWPMSEADRDEKFMDCAGRVIGEKGARALLDLAQKCEQLPDVRVLAQATLPASGVSAQSRPPARVLAT